MGSLISFLSRKTVTAGGYKRVRSNDGLTQEHSHNFDSLVTSLGLGGSPSSQVRLVESVLCCAMLCCVVLCCVGFSVVKCTTALLY